MINIKRITKYKEYLHIYNYYVSNKYLVVKIVILSIIGFLMQILIPLFNQQIIDRIVVSRSIEKFSEALIGLIVISFIYLLTSFVNQMFKLRFNNKMIFMFKINLFEHIINLPMNIYKKFSTGYLIARLNNDIDNLNGLMTNNLMSMLMSILTILVSLIIILYKNIYIFIIIFCSMILNFLTLYYINPLILKYSDNYKEAYANSYKKLEQSFNAFCHIKSLCKEKFETRQYTRILKKVIRDKIKVSMIIYLNSFIPEIITIVTNVAVLWIGMANILNNSMTIGSYFSIYMYSNYTFSSIKLLVSLNSNLQNSKNSLLRLDSIFSQEIERSNNATELTIKDSYEIEFENVEFFYEKEKKILNDVSFKIKTNRKTILLGDNGEGKSTIVKLLLKFYSPTSGVIKINNLDYKLVDTKELRNMFSVLTQDSYIFSSDLLYNMKYYKKSPSIKEFEEWYVKLFGVDDDVSDLLHKYNKEYISDLSLGQKKKVSLVQVFMKKSKFLILDEPLSYLDKKSKNNFMQYLRENNEKGFLIITHNNKNFKYIDDYIFLKKGKVNSYKSNND